VSCIGDARLTASRRHARESPFAHACGLRLNEIWTLLLDEKNKAALKTLSGLLTTDADHVLLDQITGPTPQSGGGPPPPPPAPPTP
jgi:hypothetical protein